MRAAILPTSSSKRDKVVGLAAVGTACAARAVSEAHPSLGASHAAFLPRQIVARPDANPTLGELDHFRALALA
jgi:hypothetical protein